MKRASLLTILFISFFSYAELPTLTFQDIVNIPDIDDVTLSPNGEHIAYMQKVDLENKKGVLVVAVNTKDNTSKHLAFSENEKYVITNIFWGNNNTLLMKAKFPAKRYGTATTETRILSVDVKTEKISSIFPMNLLRKMEYVPNVLSTVIDILPDEENYILMSVAGMTNGPEQTVVKMPITDEGRYSIVQSTRAKVESWLTDAKHEVRIGIHRDKTQYKVFEMKPSNEMKTLWEFEAFSKESVWPLGFGKDNDVLYIQALHQGKEAIFKVNLTDPQLTKELVFHHENYDVEGSLKKSKSTNEVVGVGYYYWDESYKNFVKSIDQALPDTDNLLLEFSEDGNTYILFASSGNEPGMYLVGNKKTKMLDVFAYRYEKLHPELLSPKKHISYQARDGLKIEGYLTYPKGDKKEKLPTIIFPHGGPISYDGSGFDYWTQFLANKGYAVLQMNFRGSSGYGHDFMQQGLASWGQAMQDDVEDGTRWLIKEGIADKDNICILGASYGGYAALMGVVKTPDLYQCAVSFAGVSNVERLVKSHRAYTNFEIVKKQIGDDYSALWDVSPQKHAEKINTPVLLVHGTKDRVVAVSQSEDMYDELKDEKKVVEFIEIEEADHFLSNNEHRIEAFTAINAFLDKYLPVKK